MNIILFRTCTWDVLSRKLVKQHLVEQYSIFKITDKHSCHLWNWHSMWLVIYVQWHVQKQITEPKYFQFRKGPFCCLLGINKGYLRERYTDMVIAHLCTEDSFLSSSVWCRLTVNAIPSRRIFMSHFLCSRN